MFKAKFLATITFATVAITFWLPNTSSQIAFAASNCNSSAGKSGSINLSSKVRAGSVVLCGDWAKVTKPVPDPAPKKVLTKPAPKTPVSTVVYKHSVVAAPNRPKILVSPASRISTATPIVLRAISQPVIRYRYLLGVPTQIKFTPVSYFWKLSDGNASRSKNFTHQALNGGSLVANLRVGFAVTFRFAAGGAWRSFDRTVRLSAAPVKVKVGDEPVKVAKLRYVLFNCFQRPDAPGCRL